MPSNEHAEHVTVEGALGADCYYGECEHIDEDGMPDDFSACPTISLEVCIDCMDERGYGRDPGNYDDALAKWPCAAQLPPLMEHGPSPRPPIFKTHRGED